MRLPASESARPVRRQLRLFGWLAFAAMWGALLAYGLHAQYAYATTAGPAGTTPDVFPEESRLPRERLLMFVHAECPCTRASLQELAALLRDRKVGATLIVAPSSGTRWRDSSAAALAKTIANLSVFADDDSEARRFGAQTSGYVVLYDARGRLRFAGGITGSRGHVGENVALADLRSLLAKPALHAAHHPVYGCALEAAQ
jgi:hypothetical protein